MNILETWISLFYGIGYFGDTIAFFITSLSTLNQPIFFIFYILFAYLNILLNDFITNQIKQKNPKNPIKFLASDTFSKHRYGMPSIHSQNMFFSIMYCYLVTKKFLLLLIIGLIVLYERYVFRDHTMKQLIYGALLGSIIGYLSYLFVKFIS
jgi:membrane-associated phospholipid phosphatase